MIETVTGFLARMPRGVEALLALAVGWLVAILLRVLLWRLLDLVRFNGLCERLRIASFLHTGRVRHTPSRLLALFAYWIALLVTFLQVSRILDIGVVESFSERLRTIVPGLLAAAFVTVIGIVAVTFVGNFVLTVARNAGLASASLVSRAVKIVGAVLVAGLALAELDIGRSLISTVLVVAFAALLLCAAIAFGLGCKDLARDAALRWIKNIRERGRAAGPSDLEG
jgi:hypothetical protein